MRKAIGIVLICLSVILLIKFIYNYKAMLGTISSVFSIVIGKSQLEDKTPMLLYFLGTILEFALALVLLFFGVKKLSKK